MTRLRLHLAAAIIGIASITWGCDDTVNPILESDQQATIFAVLDMNADTQYVRVIPVREVINPDELDATGVTLRSLDLDNGETNDWTDSLVLFDNGTTGLVFHTPLRVRPEHTYRLEVRLEGSDLVTSAQTTIPPLPEVQIFPETVERNVSPQGFQIIGLQKLEWTGLAETPWQTELWYRFLRTPSSPFRDILLPEPPPSTFESGRLDVDLDLVSDRFFVMDSVDIKKEAMIGIGMTVTVLDSAFDPPGGVFDADVLVQPGTFSNVENGFGFVGSVGRFSTDWVLREQSVRDLGYLTIEDAFGKGARPVAATTVGQGSTVKVLSVAKADARRP